MVQMVTGPANAGSESRLFYAGFEGNNILEWSGASTSGGAADPAPDQTHVRKGLYSCLMTMSGVGPFRSELATGFFPQVGQGEGLYFGHGYLRCEFSLYLDAAFPLSVNNYQAVHQLFSPMQQFPLATLEPGFNRETSTGNTRWNWNLNPNLQNGFGCQTLDLGAVVRDGWVDFRLEYWVSPMLGGSRLRGSVGGVVVVDVQPRVPTGFPVPRDRFYFKCGLYRFSGFTAAASVWVDEVALTSGGG